MQAQEGRALKIYLESWAFAQRCAVETYIPAQVRAFISASSPMSNLQISALHILQPSENSQLQIAFGMDL
jgi:hypothetical protein